MAKLHVRLCPRASVDSDAWDHFVGSSPQGSLYTMAGYLDAVAPGWQALIAEDGRQKWRAIWPLALRHRLGMAWLAPPPFSQHHGPLLHAGTADEGARSLAETHRLLSHLLNNLPSLARASIQLSPRVMSALPFYWEGYQLTTRYTYLLDLSRTESTLLAGLSSDLRRRLRQAEAQELSTETADAEVLEELIKLNVSTGHDILGDPPAWGGLRRLIDFLLTEEVGEILVVRDAQGVPLAAGLFGWHAETSLYLVGAQHPTASSRGHATPLLIWTAIQRGRERGQTWFDFEGSMLRGVGEFFRQFGAMPQAYVAASRERLPWWAQGMVVVKNLLKR